MIIQRLRSIAEKLEFYHDRFENEDSLKALAAQVRQLVGTITTPPPLSCDERGRLGPPPPLRQRPPFLR